VMAKNTFLFLHCWLCNCCRISLLTALFFGCGEADRIGTCVPYDRWVH
jgi:hypothetical protein